jgi:Fe-S-cluster-containing dehydrogenase component/CRP-like cAMP-binding protein
MTPWPRSAWESPWLVGIDGRSRAQLEAAGKVRALPRGAQLFGEGDRADAFFVVTEGLVELRGARRGQVGVVTVRRAIAGDAVGEEALVRPSALRASVATCTTDAVVVEVPLGVFRRAAAKQGEGPAREFEGRLRRSAIRDALRVSSLGASLSDEGLRALASAAVDRVVDRGDVLVAQGEPIETVLVVGDGMVQVARLEEGRVTVRAYLGRGDVIDGVYARTVTACGPAWVLVIERSAVRRWCGGFPGAVAHKRHLPLAAVQPDATPDATQDVWRFAVAGSMLVIDDEACVRCGHCASSCADAHGDGVSRLVRRGEKAVVRDAVDGSQRALVLPGSCQHCRDPVCMRDCPTGAIRRESHGEVFVREDLCVGCGACAKACPWGSVHMAPRGQAAAGTDASALVAVKCDACREVEGGPACVGACPVDAIARIDPSAAVADVHDRLAPRTAPKSLPRRRSSAGWVLGGAFVAVALCRLRATSFSAHLWTGALAGVLLAVLAGYSVAKRTRLFAWACRAGGRSRVRWHTVAHVALGVAAVGLVVAHAGVRMPPNAAGALLFAFTMASATGAAAALAYRFLPPVLAHIERQARLPEDLPQRGRELDDRAFGLLTGRSDGLKAVYERILARYARSRWGPFWLAASGRSLGEEEKRLAKHIERVVGSARAVHMDGLSDLVRWAVERRANDAQGVVQGGLRAVVPLHVVAVAATVVLLGVHLWCVARGR